MAKVSLKTYDVTFADRLKIVIGEYTTYNYFDITWSHTGHTSVKYEELLLGEKYTDEIGENEIVTPNEFKEMLEELFLLNGVLDIGDSIPWLRFLDLCYGTNESNGQ
ncbi:hypothetical protein Gotri_006209 [Gossypium trilobum]|uniref:Uncharacterized protein n=1 Tax=Gossypium trilobum TaxID=34281 RepID=A0A7J9EZK5_9ROSI|nr:hypothetical protein [Gossypium trilobum]